MQATLLSLLLMFSINKLFTSGQEVAIVPIGGAVVKIPSESYVLTSEVILQCALTPGAVNYDTQWTGPRDIGAIDPGTSSRYTISEGRVQPVAGEFRTRLRIEQLSYQDAGVYTCSGKNASNEASSRVSATIDLQLDLDLSSRFNETLVMTSTTDSTVELSCEMGAYIRPDSDLIWEGPGGQRLIDETGKYQITFSNGSPRAAANGSGALVPSRVSTLTIYHPQKSDQGVYTCSVMGTNKTVDLVIMVKTSPATTTPSSNDGSKTTATKGTTRGTPTRVMDMITNLQMATSEKVRSNSKSSLYMNTIHIIMMVVVLMSAGILLRI